MSQARYTSHSASVFNLHLHLVWWPKYRRPVLVDAVAGRLRELLYEKAAALSVEIEGLEIRPEHLHLLLCVPPTNAPQYYANQFKGYTSRLLRQEFASLRTRLPSLWSHAYYVGSAGQVSAEVIKRYIQAQKERE